MVDSLPLKLGFHTKHILNPGSMHFNPVKVSLVAFAILLKIHSAYRATSMTRVRGPIMRTLKKTKIRSASIDPSQTTQTRDPNLLKG